MRPHRATLNHFCSSLALGLLVTFLEGCQGHLPPLETSPKVHAPKVQTLIEHIECELGTIVNYDSADPNARADNPRLYERVTDDKSLEGLLSFLSKYHFVATAQLSLEVTDMEGFNPTLAYMNASGQGVFSLGGQLSGTQDRSLTINYAIDLAKLVDSSVPKKYGRQNCPKPDYDLETRWRRDLGLTGALSGDLGLADIVADGLLALNQSANLNIYTSAGPVPPAIARKVTLIGHIDLPDGATTYTISSLVGTLLLAPQASGSTTQGTASLSGILLLTHDGVQTRFMVNWSGTIAPPTNNGSLYYFSLSGNLTPLLNGSDSGLTKKWGYNPTITLTGVIDQQIELGSLAIYGVVGAAANSAFEKTPPITLALARDPNGKEAAGAPTPGSAPQATKGGAGASAGSGTGTSFGSLVDFTIVFGANGGPNWTFKRFKGPTGASAPFLSATRTRIDSLAISFVASCQDFQGVSASFGNYWNSIGACDDITSALQQGAISGGQNNSLMILRNFLLLRP
jgi:hypothetical protein